MRPPQILVETEVVSSGVVWKSRKPCLDFDFTYCLVSFRPGDDPSVKTSGEELTRGVAITYLDDLFLTGWQYHLDAITKAVLEKYAMKRSGSLPYDVQGEKPSRSESECVAF